MAVASAPSIGMLASDDAQAALNDSLCEILLRATSTRHACPRRPPDGAPADPGAGPVRNMTLAQVAPQAMELIVLVLLPKAQRGEFRDVGEFTLAVERLASLGAPTALCTAIAAAAAKIAAAPLPLLVAAPPAASAAQAAQNELARLREHGMARVASGLEPIETAASRLIAFGLASAITSPGPSASQDACRCLRRRVRAWHQMASAVAPAPLASHSTKRTRPSSSSSSSLSRGRDSDEDGERGGGAEVAAVRRWQYVLLAASGTLPPLQPSSSARRATPAASQAPPSPRSPPSSSAQATEAAIVPGPIQAALAAPVLPDDVDSFLAMAAKAGAEAMRRRQLQQHVEEAAAIKESSELALPSPLPSASPMHGGKAKKEALDAPTPAAVSLLGARSASSVSESHRAATQPEPPHANPAATAAQFQYWAQLSQLQTLQLQAQEAAAKEAPPARPLGAASANEALARAVADPTVDAMEASARPADQAGAAGAV
jgi:hypothetical protein